MENTEQEMARIPMEMDDNELDVVVGGVDIGQTVQLRSSTIQYCKGCGKLLDDYSATITGVRGVVDGRTIYWIKRTCCGYATSVIETVIVG